MYSSAGFGGGSSYLAILALFGVSFMDLRLIALCCNIMVVSGSLFLFYRSGLFRSRQMWSLVILSIPLAYIGGLIPISESVFFIVLGFVLLLSAILMLIPRTQYLGALPKNSNVVIGGAIGFLSGMVGIGGGIFLSPILHLSKWDKPKVIACATAFFILVNSLSGLAGQLYANGFHVDYSKFLLLIVVVFVGGQIGSRMTIHAFSPLTLKRVTGCLILFVSLRLLYSNLW